MLGFVWLEVVCCFVHAVAVSVSSYVQLGCPAVSGKQFAYSRPLSLAQSLQPVSAMILSLGWGYDVPFRAEHPTVTHSCILTSCGSQCLLPSTAKRNFFDDQSVGTMRIH